MTTELVLLLTIFAFVLLGVFIGDAGPIATFNNSAPRLGARIERNISVGSGFRNKLKNAEIQWDEP